MDKEVAERIAQWAETQVNPYLLPPERQGWRGLSIPGNRKRKWFTVLHNDQILVTALLQIPGETGCRHSHETGELSIHYHGELKPLVTWNPPGIAHGGIPYNAGRTPLATLGEEMAELLREEAPGEASSPEVAALTRRVQSLQKAVHQLVQERIEASRPDPEPRVIVDVLFPPFRTTIVDPAYPEHKTIVGQWYD